MENCLISVNVGGKTFTTTWLTLQSLPDTLLAEMTRPEFPFEDKDEEIYLSEDSGAKESENSSLYTPYKDTICVSQFPNRNRLNYILIDTQSSQSDFITKVESLNNEGRRSTLVNHTTNNNSSITQNRYSRVENGDTNRHETSKHCTDKSPLYITEISVPNDKLEESKRKQSVPLLGPGKEHTLFFDRNPLMMPFILDAYRLGVLHLPHDMCSLSIKEELKFWKIPEELISECCWKKYSDGHRDVRLIKDICKAFFDPFVDPIVRARMSLFSKIWLTLETPFYSIWGKIYFGLYTFFVAVSVLSFTLSSLQDLLEVKSEFEDLLDDHGEPVQWDHENATLHPAHWNVFLGNAEPLEVIDHVIRVYFVLDLIIRFILCPMKWNFIRDSHNILDFVVTLLMWSKFVMHEVIVLNAGSYDLNDDSLSHTLLAFNCLTVLRVFRIFHLTKHFAAIKVMQLSFKESRKELGLLILLLFVGVLICGTMIYLAEGLTVGAETTFTSVLLGMWWSMVTITTVGYGDYYPTSWAGYLVGSYTAVCGVLLISMPVAIIAKNFSGYYDSLDAKGQNKRRQRYFHNFHAKQRKRHNSSNQTKSVKDGRIEFNKTSLPQSNSQSTEKQKTHSEAKVNFSPPRSLNGEKLQHRKQKQSVLIKNNNSKS